MRIEELKQKHEDYSRRQILDVVCFFAQIIIVAMLCTYKSFDVLVRIIPAISCPVILFIIHTVKKRHVYIEIMAETNKHKRG